MKDDIRKCSNDSTHNSSNVWKCGSRILLHDLVERESFTSTCTVLPNSRMSSLFSPNL